MYWNKIRQSRTTYNFTPERNLTFKLEVLNTIYHLIAFLIKWEPENINAYNGMENLSSHNKKKF